MDSDITRNQLNVVHNEFQKPHKYKRALCVCSAGILRSPTMAKILGERFNYNTRAVGATPEYALIPASHALVEWSDIIFCADEWNQQAMLTQFGKRIKESKKLMYCLNIPDNYNYRDTELETAIIESYTNIFNEQ